MNILGPFGHDKILWKWYDLTPAHLPIIMTSIQLFAILFCLFINCIDITRRLIDDILTELDSNALGDNTAVPGKEMNDTPISKNGKRPPKDSKSSKPFKEAISSDFSERKYVVAAKNSEYITSSTKALSIYPIMCSRVCSSVASIGLLPDT